MDMSFIDRQIYHTVMIISLFDKVMLHVCLCIIMISPVRYLSHSYQQVKYVVESTSGNWTNTI